MKKKELERKKEYCESVGKYCVSCEATGNFCEFHPDHKAYLREMKLREGEKHGEK